MILRYAATDQIFYDFIEGHIFVEPDITRRSVRNLYLAPSFSVLSNEVLQARQLFVPTRKQMCTAIQCHTIHKCYTQGGIALSWDLI